MAKQSPNPVADWGTALLRVKNPSYQIKFVGVGEKDADLYPDRMASRILGMGDALLLIDRPDAGASPRLINGHRKKRIAKGSRPLVQEINRLLKLA